MPESSTPVSLADYYRRFYHGAYQRSRGVVVTSRTADLIYGMARHYGVRVGRMVDLGAGTGNVAAQSESEGFELQSRGNFLAFNRALVNGTWGFDDMVWGAAAATGHGRRRPPWTRR